MMPKTIIATLFLAVVASAITASVLLVMGQESEQRQQRLDWPERVEPSPEPTRTLTDRESTRGALGCVNCRVKAGDQLKVTVEDIQLGKDGKYYVPDRGDGCAYREVEWGPGQGSSWVTLHAPGCEIFWVYRPVIGEVRGVIP